jgi:large subunit ribosomal protein L17
MRHNNAINPLGRKSAHRESMLANMASSLILHKRIKTTTAKAKALRVFIEPILTKSKADTTHARRHAFSCLRDKKAVHELFKEVAPKIVDRPGGYTRILKLGNRLGDAAEMCFIELVDFNENMLATKETAQKTTRRGRRGSAKKKQAEGVSETAARPDAEKQETTENSDNSASQTTADTEPEK